MNTQLVESIAQKTLQLSKYTIKVEKGQQFFEDHEVVGMFPKYFKQVEVQAELLVDTPEIIEEVLIDIPEVEEFHAIEPHGDEVILIDESEFKSKKVLEDYGKTFGIDLNRQKSIKNMYADLVEFVK